MQRNEIRGIVGRLSALGEADGYIIIRAESRREWNIKVNNGKVERVVTLWDSGMGVQAFTKEGACGFAASDSLSEEAGRDLVTRAFSLAERNERLGAERNTEIWQAVSVEVDLLSPAKLSFEEIPLNQLQQMVLEIHLRLREKSPEVIWQTSYRQVEDTWHIGRSDGTLVSFTIPRAVISHQGTVRVQGRAQNTMVHHSGMDAGIILEESEKRSLETQAVERAAFAYAVCQAPQLPSGHYPLIIEYGLAKGLAHEAFGHAVESDHMKESVLGANGRLTSGLRVARPGVNIIDGPLEGDWAYQPYSANGIFRETVSIVRDGVLEAGLGDVFTAREAGMPVSGAGRAESYGHIPLPRMSNIRLLTDRVLPLEATPNVLAEAKNIRDALLAHGEMRLGEKNLLLLGYRGGQVNPKTGDFVFQCEGMIDVGDPALPVCQPAIFSGKILSALQAIRGGLGDERFDAIGTCGKNGQGVPSSGGSHRYVLMDSDEHVSLGGTANGASGNTGRFTI